MSRVALGWLSGLVGGLLGYFIFLWIAKQGFYALILPGAAVGFGSLVAQVRSQALALGVAVLALAFGIFSEWRFAPFATDSSFGYFVGHLHKLRPVTLILIGVGAVISYWVAIRQEGDGKAGPGSGAGEG